MQFPRVSIIIPVYNGSNYLANAIECALGQTYGNLEVIVVNDGSTDEGKTESIALSYGDRIRYYRKENGGVSSALNYGIGKMTGEYFSWLSHDDAYSADKIQDSIALLRSRDALGKKVMAFTGGWCMDTLGNKIGDFPRYFTPNQLYSGLDVVRIMTRKGTLNGCCMLIPRAVFDDVGGFHENLRYSQDSLMWYQIFLSGCSLVSDNLPNVMYRLHRNQASQLRRDLFEHDALVIAGLLAEPLTRADSTGDLLMRYIKRLTKYECNDAVRYLCAYAEENGYLNGTRKAKILMFRCLGFFRYRIATVRKKMLIHFRRKG